MPNYDAGHYFLTVLAPIRPDSILRDGQSYSRRHLIREVLARMPTGDRTAASLVPSAKEQAPFALNTATHFARFAVLDDVVFNGRVSGDSLLSLAQRIDPMTPQKVDRLSTPFLIFAADFDAMSDADGELKSYLVKLWEAMSKHLTDIFQHCIGFEAVTTADAFFQYIKKCQIETTMPFNDYWSTAPDLANLSFMPYIAGALVALAAFGIGVFLGIIWLWLGGLLALGLVVYLVYRAIMDTGQKPFPTSAPPAPSSDLPTVLKALYLQRAFTRMAISVQGCSDDDLYQEFGRFVASKEPLNINQPTQRPGVIGVEPEA